MVIYLPTGVPDLLNSLNSDYGSSVVLVLVSASDKGGSISNYTFPVTVYSFFHQY